MLIAISPSRIPILPSRTFQTHPCSDPQKDVPIFSVSTPDLTDIEMSVFATANSGSLSVSMTRVESHEPLTVASCPTSPSKVKRRAGFLRKFVNKLTTKKSSHAHRRGLFLTAPRQAKLVSSPSRRATLSATRAPADFCSTMSQKESDLRASCQAQGQGCEVG
ncbi:hypothetical protein MVEN_00159800 [Mycena venus]|uniref:Uncharacterized protein n=1 Tax=Mycena venus TaxID=2733690 RepID=A0A8H7DEA9_9AGAR|nr:hypothetical protein MVEN_00159800 [Mycena venus]